ncbi:MAG: bifunctional ornithine acetyltransferase/N-acetylglutamate synthase [Clostridiales bacterium]
MTKFAGAVTAAQGFKASGVHVGIKASNKEKKDMAMISSSVPCVIGAMFTTNVMKAAPVQYDMEILKKGVAQGVIINSGNANACTGQQGLEDAKTMAKKTAELLGVDGDMVLVASTGVIGHNLPMAKISDGITKAYGELSVDGGHCAAQAILTTDIHAKEMALTMELDGISVTIGGMAKGSGMICPNMATMLGFITTDAAIDGDVLQCALNDAVAQSFNQISVDGDMSTNDTVLILANGLAGNAKIKKGSKNYTIFVENLTRISVYLAKKIARDGEGANHLFEAEVRGAATVVDARKIAKSVVSSNLVKAAVFGKDANWGRIICAVGYAGVDFDPTKVNIYIESEKGRLFVAKDGGGLEFNEDYAAEVMEKENIKAVIELQEGEAVGTAWGCDLSYDYVKINADYRT